MRRQRRPYDTDAQRERAVDIIGRYPGRTTAELRATHGLTAAEQRQLSQMESDGQLRYDHGWYIR